MHQHLSREGGPSLYWSRKNHDGLTRWLSDGEHAPFAMELTSKVGNGDEWFAKKSNDTIVSIRTTDLAQAIAKAFIEQMGED